MATRACEVSNDNCLAPAGYQVGSLGCAVNPSAHARLTCFACGCAVCSRCSRKINYLWYGRQTVCDRCREEMKK